MLTPGVWSLRLTGFNMLWHTYLGYVHIKVCVRVMNAKMLINGLINQQKTDWQWFWQLVNHGSHLTRTTAYSFGHWETLPEKFNGFNGLVQGHLIGCNDKHISLFYIITNGLLLGFRLMQNKTFFTKLWHIIHQIKIDIKVIHRLIDDENNQYLQSYVCCK